MSKVDVRAYVRAEKAMRRSASHLKINGCAQGIFYNKDYADQKCNIFWRKKNIFKCEALLRIAFSARARARTNVNFTQILRPLGLDSYTQQLRKIYLLYNFFHKIWNVSYSILGIFVFYNFFVSLKCEALLRPVLLRTTIRR